MYVAGTVNVSPELLEPTAEEAFAARVHCNVASPKYREDIGLDLKVLLLLSFAIARPKRRVPTEHDEHVQHVVLTHACCELLYFGFILTPNSSRQPHAKGSFLDFIAHRNDDDGGVVLLCLCHATFDRGSYLHKNFARAVFWNVIDALDICTHGTAILLLGELANGIDPEKPHYAKRQWTVPMKN